MWLPSSTATTSPSCLALPESEDTIGLVFYGGPMNDVDAHELVTAAARAARTAQRSLARAPHAVKDAALEAMAHSLTEHTEAILAANAADLERGRESGMKSGLLDRLALDAGRLSDIAGALREVAALPDPVGEIIDGSVMPNGLRVRRVRVPLGVVGMIYEARPNVTVDTAALAVKSGNAIILRGGSAAQDSNAAIVAALRSALDAQGLPADLVTSVDAAGRDGARALMRAHGLVDALVPRGGAGLIRAVVEQSTVPVIETGSGNCHVYVDASADLQAAVDIIVNAKTQRVGVCNAAETLLVHIDVAADYLPEAAAALWDKDTVLHADPAAHRILTEVAGGERLELLVEATEDDWDTEYGSLDLAVRVVEDLEEAVDHIRAHTTGHTEAVLAQDVGVIKDFIAGMDSAAIMVNASTRFTDGGQLGLGAELGISTQKLHARGPMGLTELTTTTWIVEGDGHTRP